MHSDDDLDDRYRALLFEYADGVLDGARARAIAERLESDPALAADYAAIMDMRMRAQVWHDQQPPAWQPPRIPGRPWWLDFRDWFPTVASAAALLVAVAVWVRGPEDLGGQEPPGPRVAAGQVADAAGFVATEPADDPRLVEAVLEASREQRSRELASLVRLMTAEMDRRSIETEESLRYIIAHQIQGQQELDDLSQRVAHIDYTPNGGRTSGGKLQ